MRRYAQVIRVAAGDEAEYIRYHAAVWPTVLKTIAECGIRNYSIFLRSGVLFAYFEYHGTDYEADMRKMAADPETQRWWAIMDPMQAADGRCGGGGEVVRSAGGVSLRRAPIFWDRRGP